VFGEVLTPEIDFLELVIENLDVIRGKVLGDLLNVLPVFSGE